MKIAILVDGDNAQSKILKSILEEVSKYGKVTIRRIYGDWTSSHMNRYKELLNNLSFNPIQKFSYTTGKNSTDSSLIIDAMDILHDKIVDGFCIVSSDSDYTGLAKRIREEGVFVMGIGEKKTPNAFVQSCEIFTYCENITPDITKEEEDEEEEKKSGKAKRTKKPESRKLTAADKKLIDKAFDMSADEGVDTYIAQIGLNLRKINPSFDPRAYGFKNLSQLFEKLPSYQIIRNEVKGLNHPIIKKK